MAFDKCPICGYKESNANHLVANTFNHYKHKTTGLIEVFSTDKPIVENDRGEWVKVTKVDGEWKASASSPITNSKAPIVPIDKTKAVPIDTTINTSKAPIGKVEELVVLPQVQL